MQSKFAETDSVFFIKMKLLTLCLLVLTATNIFATSTTPPTPATDAQVPRCITVPLNEVNQDSLQSPPLDLDDCHQPPRTFLEEGDWNLMATMESPLTFRVTPYYGFKYFEILFLRGYRSVEMNLLQVNGSFRHDFMVKLTFENIPITSTAPRLAANVFIQTQKNTGDSRNVNSNNNRRGAAMSSSNDHFSCATGPAPDQQHLSRLLLRVYGPSQWQFVPDVVNCNQSSYSSNDENIASRYHPSDRTPRRNQQNDLNAFTPYRTTERTHLGGRNESFSIYDPNSRYAPSSSSSSPLVHPRTRIPSYATAPVWHHDVDTTPGAPYHEGHNRTHGHDSTRAPAKMAGYHNAVLITAILGVVAFVLLVVGCCFLFRHLNLSGSYGIHGNTYEPESSLHLRESQYSEDTAPGATPKQGTRSPKQGHKAPSDAVHGPGTSNHHGIIPIIIEPGGDSGFGEDGRRGHGGEVNLSMVNENV